MKNIENLNKRLILRAMIGQKYVRKKRICSLAMATTNKHKANTQCIVILLFDVFSRKPIKFDKSRAVDNVFTFKIDERRWQRLFIVIVWHKHQLQILKLILIKCKGRCHLFFQGLCGRISLVKNNSHKVYTKTNDKYCF